MAATTTGNIIYYDDKNSTVQHHVGKYVVQYNIIFVFYQICIASFTLKPVTLVNACLVCDFLFHISTALVRLGLLKLTFL
jgi:hypothetical protein